MKIIADRAALLNAVNLVSSVVPLRSPSAALTCLKITATKAAGVGQLKLSGTDAETSLEIILTQVDIATPGSAVVSADKLRQILSNLAEADPTVTMELDGDACHIRGNSAKFKILAFPQADYPPFPDYQTAVAGAGSGASGSARAVFAHPVSSFSRLVARTAFATAKEVSRYAINGVLLKRDGKRLEMVATDGRRLALCRTSIKAAAGNAGDGPVQCIVPTKALTLFSKLSHNADDTARIAITDNRIFIALEDGLAPEPKDGKKPAASAPAAGPRAVLSSTLVEGAFPPYEDVIPKDQDKKATAGRDEFAAAVRQAGVLTNEESRGIRMNFSSKARTCKLSSRAPEVGESEIDLPLSAYEGEDVEICFNPAFFGDVLKAVDEPEVIVELKAPNKPGILRAGPDFLYVLMPVNLPA